MTLLKLSIVGCCPRIKLLYLLLIDLVRLWCERVILWCENVKRKALRSKQGKTSSAFLVISRFQSVSAINNYSVSLMLTKLRQLS